MEDCPVEESVQIKSEAEIRRCIAGVSTKEQLVRAVAELPEWVAVEGIVHGHLKKEHIAKQIAYALRFNAPSVITASPSLRNAATAFMDPARIQEQVSEDAYMTILQERFRTEKITDEELFRFSERMSIDVWCSIDTDMELPIFLAQSQERIFTHSSCSGHSMESKSARAYFLCLTNDPVFVDVVRTDPRTIRYMGTFDVERAGLFSARSPLDMRDVPFEEAEKGWALLRFEFPGGVEKERFGSMMIEQRKKERDVFMKYLGSILQQYRKVSKSTQ